MKKSFPAHLFGTVAAFAVLVWTAGCSSSPPASSMAAEPQPEPVVSDGPLGIYGNLERKGTQNYVHVFINGTEVIDGPLNDEYEGTNHGRYGSSDVRSECRTKRLNLHDFRVTCDVYVDGVKQSTLGF